MRRTFPAGGHGELYCPWCSAALVQAELSPVEVAAAHVRENGHTGRPVQVNRALRLAAESLAATEEGRTGG